MKFLRFLGEVGLQRWNIYVYQVKGFRYGWPITYWTQSELYTVEQITLAFWTGQSMDVFRKDYINFIYASNV
jgi:hypothetical protein